MSIKKVRKQLLSALVICITIYVIVQISSGNSSPTRRENIVPNSGAESKPLKNTQHQDVSKEPEHLIGINGNHFAPLSDEECDTYFNSRTSENADWNNRMLDIKDQTPEVAKKIGKMLESVEMLGRCMHHSDQPKYKGIYHKVFPFLNDRIDSDFWPKFNGRGIAMTMKPDEINIARKTISIIRSFTDMPIEIIHAGILDSDVHYGENVKVIDAQKFMHFKLTSYLFKWMAPMFSSFEEVIVIEPDVVVFSNPETWFDLANGKTLLFPRNKQAGTKIGEGCKTMFGVLDKVRATPKSSSDFGDEDVYNRFYNNYERELIDASVVVTNRKNNFIGITAAFNLQLTTPTMMCFIGDKEFYWLGHVLTGNPVNILPGPAAILGDSHANEIYARPRCQVYKNELLWCNGGLDFCPSQDAVVRDIDYWKNEGFDATFVEDMYTLPFGNPVVVVPDADDWQFSSLCDRTMAKLPNKNVVELTKNSADNFRNVYKIWMADALKN